MRPGYQIGNYVIVEQIGQGGQAAVWSADDEQLKRLVAVKTINIAPSGAADEIPPEVQAERFRHEARLIADLEHPYILPIYAFGQDGDWLYLVMRYMAGGTLKKLLQKQPKDLSRVVALARPIAGALDVAHERSIVHRDIKSANILIDSRQNAYLADFGLSITVGTVDTSAMQSSGAGTLAYMSPEQMRSEPVDPRSDLYAFGILLYEMLTGSVPLINNQPWNLQQLTNGASLPIPDSMPRGVADVLCRATAFDPSDRYRHATEIVDALAGVLTERSTAEPMGDVIEFTDESVEEGEEKAKPRGPLPVTDPAMLALIKANEMFETALADWADGAGRFHLDADDFQYIDSFYSANDSWGVNLDDAARRLLLRAALEHGYNADLWWDRAASVADRRSVALQALTSQLPAARLRGMLYLAKVEDSDPPAIPVRVAAIIRKEPDSPVRLAGVHLLENRAGPISNWRPVAYDATVDSTLAELAAHDPDPKVAEAAARACARLHSEVAITRLGQKAAGGDHGALKALVDARDEIKAFPAGVSGVIRRRVFVLLSLRQFVERGLGARYIAAALGFAIGWGLIQSIYYSGQLATQAIGNAAASGVLYGVLAGFAILVGSELPARLRSWTRPERLILALAVGGVFSTVVFFAVRRYYYFSEEDINWLWLIGPSVLFIGGFAIASGLTRQPFVRAVTGAIGAFAGVWLAWFAYLKFWTPDPLIYFSNDEPGQSLALAVLLALAVGLFTFLPEGLRSLARLSRRLI